MSKDVELLSPVGSKEAFTSAIKGGADAIYMGGKLFNARHYASNFEDDELKNMVDYAHRRGVKIYITMNISLKQDEIYDAIEYVGFLYDIGVDGIIVQDLGLMKNIRSMYPDFPVHASTQMTVHNTSAAKLLEEIGVSRIVVAREMSIDEIRELTDHSNIEVEAFIHGAICISYSGQCLMSSLIGGRSGNRGRCAQTCRMPFSIENRSGDQIEIEGRYLLSPKDLNSIDNLGNLIGAGVSSLKIEGRMKSPEYVFTVVKSYRETLDDYFSGVKTENSGVKLKKVFNRGFTKGFLGGDFGKALMSIERPNNSGEYIGEVLKIRDGMVILKSLEELGIGDTITFRNSRGESSAQIDYLEQEGKKVNRAYKDKVVAIKVGIQAQKNDRVYKTKDAEFEKNLEFELAKAESKKEAVDMKVRLKSGERPYLEASFRGVEFSTYIDNTVEKAQNMPLTDEKVIKQLSKLGNTDYLARNIEVDIDPDIFVPMGALNNLRRSMVEKLDEYRSYKPVRVHRESIFELENSKDKYTYKKTKMSISIKNRAQIYKLDPKKLDRIYIPIDMVDEQVSNIFRAEDVEVYAYISRIVSNLDMDKLEDKLIEKKHLLEGISTGNMGVVNLIGKKFSKLSIHSDMGNNLFNTESAKMLGILGSRTMLLSPELNLREIEDICGSHMEGYEALAYGYLELMTMKHCPMSVIRDCGESRNCEICKFSDGYSLVDRKNMKFSITRDNDITTIYNSRRIFIPEYLDRLKRSCIEFIRLNFTSETDEISFIQDLYYNELNGIESFRRYRDNNIYKHIKSDSTKGHYFRGVL